MASLEYQNKKTTKGINYQNFQGILLNRVFPNVEASNISSEIVRADYDLSSNFGTWRTVYSIHTYSSPKQSLIDPDLQKLSQKVMKKTWDNKEDEFWNTY